MTLAPGETKNFTLSVRIDPSKLEKTRDPAADVTQNATDYYTGVETVPAQYRQYIASASGRLVLAEDNGQRHCACPSMWHPNPSAPCTPPTAP